MNSNNVLAVICLITVREYYKTVTAIIGFRITNSILKFLLYAISQIYTCIFVKNAKKYCLSNTICINGTREFVIVLLPTDSYFCDKCSFLFVIFHKSEIWLKIAIFKQFIIEACPNCEKRLLTTLPAVGICEISRKRQSRKRLPDFTCF